LVHGDVMKSADQLRTKLPELRLMSALRGLFNHLISKDQRPGIRRGNASERHYAAAGSDFLCDQCLLWVKSGRGIRIEAGFFWWHTARRHLVLGVHVRFGSKADICSAKGHVRFTPNSDRKSGFPHKVMSALPPKANINRHSIGRRTAEPNPLDSRVSRL